MKRVLVGLTLTLACLLPLSAAATQIGAGAFGSSATVESFEGVVVGANVRQSVFANILEPAVSGSYAFASGIILSAPVPNPGTLNNGAFIHDFSLPAGATNGWGANGSVSSAADVPFGSAYLAAFDNLNGATVPTSFSLDFGSDMLRAGAYVTGAAGTTVRIDAYGAFGNLLESAQMSTVAVTAWNLNFLGLESTSGIRRMVFSGVDFGIDGLTFEGGAMPVPEPSTAIFVLGGLIGLAVNGRRTRAAAARRA